MQNLNAIVQDGAYNPLSSSKGAPEPDHSERSPVLKPNVSDTAAISSQNEDVTHLMDKTSPLSGNSDMEGGLSLQKIPGGMEISIFLAPL